MSVLSAVIFMALGESREKGDNTANIRQAREYMTALEIVYRTNGNNYISFQTNPPSDSVADNWGCLVDTTGGGNCEWGSGSNPSVFPDDVGGSDTGITNLRDAIKVAPLPVPVISDTGHLFSAITYRSEDRGRSYQIRFPLYGEGQDCKLPNSKRTNSGGSGQFDGVSICTVCSNSADTHCH